MKALVMAVLAVLLTQAVPGCASAAPKGKFVRAWAECDAFATERGFGRNNTARFSRTRFVRKCRRGVIA